MKVIVYLVQSRYPMKCDRCQAVSGATSPASMKLFCSVQFRQFIFMVVELIFRYIFQLANSYRKGHQQKPFNIKAQGSDNVLTEPDEMKEW